MGATRVIEYCANPSPSPQPTPRVEAEKAPGLIRNARPRPAPATAEPQRPSAEGSFVELRCTATTASLVLQLSGGETRVYLIDKPAQVVLQNTGKGTMEMTCGPQTGRKVTVEFEAAPQGGKVDGLLRLLRYE